VTTMRTSSNFILFCWDGITLIRPPKNENTILMDVTDTAHFSCRSHSTSLRSSNNDTRETKQTTDAVNNDIHNRNRLMMI
jgi:hypothetical protein